MMSFRFVAVLILLGVAAASSAESLAPAVVVSSSRLSHPDHFGFELGGRGGLFSLQYDRAVSDHLALGVGLSALPTFEESGFVATIPVYANLYAQKTGSTPFLTAGTTLVFVNGGPLPIPVIGAGYEARSRSGFTTRFTGYMLPTGGPSFWAGITVGTR